MNDFTVYMHINKTNDKRYIGITGQDVRRRWRPDGSGYKSNPLFGMLYRNMDGIILNISL